jgi:hypothetical protein
MKDKSGRMKRKKEMFPFILHPSAFILFLPVGGRPQIHKLYLLEPQNHFGAPGSQPWKIGLYAMDGHPSHNLRPISHGKVQVQRLHWVGY